jgi:glycosyltransferase involved in cell wall biosynthesis
MMVNAARHRLKIFTWHVHGTYLYYLSQGEYDIYIPISEKKEEGYYGRGQTFPFGANVIEVPAAHVRNMHFDCILFQTKRNFLKDQFDILSEEQRELPSVFIQHDPPWEDPTDAEHVMNRTNGILVHVTNFNKLMWKNVCPRMKVIEHGVMVPAVGFGGQKKRGVVVINHLHHRGRKLGADIFNEVKKRVPLDLVGMGTAEYGGLGEILHPRLPEFISQYRFFFNPIRYTSLGLAVCEAMMLGMPVVTLATTEYVTVIEDGKSGFIHTDVDYLVEKMLVLLESRTLATALGIEARKTAVKRFDIARFVKEWTETFYEAAQLNMDVHERENSVYQ